MYVKKPCSIWIGTLIAGALFSGSALADNLTYDVSSTFPGFSAWQNTPGTSLAVGVSNYTDIAYSEFLVGTRERLDRTFSDGTTTLRGISEAEIGRNRSWGSAATTNQSGSANVISLWKDSFAIDQAAKVTIKLQIDGTVPVVPSGTPLAYGNSIAVFDFGVFRVSDGKKMAEFYTLDWQSLTNTTDSATWLNEEGLQEGSEAVNQLRVGGPEFWDVSLTPYLAPGEYEFRSMLVLTAAANVYINSNVLDFLNTASFERIAVPEGVNLSSASGLLSEVSPGVYGYPISSVPESSSILLALAGLLVLGARFRSRAH